MMQQVSQDVLFFGGDEVVLLMVGEVLADHKTGTIFKREY